MLCFCVVGFPETLWGRACRLGTFRTLCHLFQKFRLIEVLIILDLVISYFQSQGHDLEPGILQIFFRQFTTAVYYNFITHIIYLHMIDCSYSKLCLRKSHSANAALNSYNYFHFLKTILCSF